MPLQDLVESRIRGSEWQREKRARKFDFVDGGSKLRGDPDDIGEARGVTSGGGQSSTAFELALAMATGKYKPGFKAWGLSPETKAGSEAPANDAAVVGQCYLVPFKAVTKENYKSFMTKK